MCSHSRLFVHLILEGYVLICVFSPQKVEVSTQELHIEFQYHGWLCHHRWCPFYANNNLPGRADRWIFPGTRASSPSPDRVHPYTPREK